LRDFLEITAGACAQAHQWIFLTDSSFGPPEQHPEAPRIMAVQLQAQAEAIDFLTPAADVGSLASLR
jgi:hypothetical protein